MKCDRCRNKCSECGGPIHPQQPIWVQPYYPYPWWGIVPPTMPYYPGPITVGDTNTPAFTITTTNDLRSHS